MTAPPGAGGLGGTANPDDLFDWALILGWASYVLSAPRRHKLLTLVVLAAAVATSAGLLAALPRTYHTEATVLASRNLVMPALGNPGRAIPGDADAPTRAAAETILRRDNLLVLIEQTDLMKQWEASRAPLSKVRDYVVAKLRGPLDDEEKRDALVYTLERRLRVTTGESSITIEIDWPDAKMAFRLVALAQQNFLESRHALEVSTIAEAISILEGHAAAARGRVDGALEELRKQPAGRRVAAAEEPRLPRIVVHEGRADDEASNIRLMLVAKRRALQDLEEYRRRRLSELQSQLAEQTATYTAVHPLVMATRESIDSLQKDSPQLASLRREERDLLRQYVARGGRDPDVEPAASAAPRHVQVTYPREPRVESAPADETALYWRTQLDFATQKYEELVNRIEAARIELDTARAAFKYRYAIFRPAEVPKRPSKPNAVVVIFAGVVAGIALAVGVTAVVDIRRGLVLQAWQIERQLGLPLLARLGPR